MKVNGKILARPEPTTVVIPRGEDEYVFKAQAVTDFEEFNRLCPEPEAGFKMLPGGAQVKDASNPEFRQLHREWQLNRSHWMILTSLSATEGLEWSSVNMEDPATWSNYAKELEDAGFSGLEVGALMDAVTDANGLNQARIDEATKRFLALQAEVKRQRERASQSSEPQSTPSGKPASASV